MMAIRFDDVGLEITLGILAGVGIASLISLLHAIPKLEADSYTVVRVVDRGPDVAGYVATYLLPLLTVSQPTTRDLLAYGLFLAIVGLIYLRSGMAAINPLLYLFRYRVATIETDDGKGRSLVARSVPEPGEVVVGQEVVPGLVLSG